MGAHYNLRTASRQTAITKFMYIKYQFHYHLRCGNVVERRTNCMILVSFRFQVARVQTSYLHYFVSPIFSFFFVFLSFFLPFFVVSV